MKDEWLIKGHLSNTKFKKGAVVALSGDGTQFNTTIKDNMSFGMNLPGNTTYALYFIMPQEFNFSPQSQSEDIYAVLCYENGLLGESETLRLPHPTFYPVLDLGVIDIKGRHAYPGRSPSTVLDFDFDGIVDAKDPDDQNDGLNDKEQKTKAESVKVCLANNGHYSEKTIHLSKLLPFLDQGAIIGPCPKNK